MSQSASSSGSAMLSVQVELSPRLFGSLVNGTVSMNIVLEDKACEEPVRKIWYARATVIGKKLHKVQVAPPGFLTRSETPPLHHVIEVGRFAEEQFSRYVAERSLGEPLHA